MGHLLAVCLDCGDTLVDEGTEEKNELGETQRCSLIPGAAEMVRALHARGYRLALVADGPEATFRNVFAQHGFGDCFETLAISQLVGVEKPAAAMFEHAMNALGIAPEEYGRVVMVGNNLERDIAGANALGMISVWLDWAPRRKKVPDHALEVPQYTIRKPWELVALLEEIEKAAATSLEN